MKSDIQLAWRNLWRNKRRSFLSMGGIVFSSGILVFMLSMQFYEYQLMLRASVDSGTGYLQAQAKGFLDDQRMWLVLDDPTAVERTMLAEKRVQEVTRRSEGFSLLASGAHSLGALVVGVQPEGELRVTKVAKTVREGEFLKDGDFDQAVFGALLAKNLGVGLGDSVTILGSARDGSIAAAEVVIKGIFTTGQPELDRALLYVPLTFFDEIYRMDGAAHRVISKADSLWWLKPIAAKLSREFNVSDPDAHPPVVLTWQDLLPGLLEGIQLDMIIGAVMYVILVLVVAFSILNTFIMAVFERTREFGVMMAIGTTPGRLVRILLIESAFLTLVGVVVGIALGSAVTMYYGNVGISLGEETAGYMAQFGLPPRLHPELTVLTAILGPAFVFLITILAALVPAMRIRRLRPVEALRKV